MKKAIDYILPRHRPFMLAYLTYKQNNLRKDDITQIEKHAAKLKWHWNSHPSVR